MVLVLINGISNQFKVSYKQCLVQMCAYLAVLIGLVVYSIANDVKPPTG